MTTDDPRAPLVPADPGSPTDRLPVPVDRPDRWLPDLTSYHATSPTPPHDGATTGPPDTDATSDGGPQLVEPYRPAASPEPTGSVRFTSSYDIPLDAVPDPTARPVPVDIADTTATDRRWSDGERQPIIPSGLRRGSLAPTVRHTVGHLTHVAAFHAVRLPWYTLLTTWTAAVGAARLLDRQRRWWWCTEAAVLLHTTAEAADPASWLKLHREVRATRLRRGLTLAVEFFAFGWGLLWLPAVVDVLPWLVTLLLGGTALVVLARFGRPAGRPLLPSAVVTPRYRRLTADVVLRAYYAARLGAPDKPGQQIEFGSPMARDGEGSRVLIDLPYGKGFGDAVRARDAIASGLDVATAQVFLTRDPTSHRRHGLWVADRDPLAVPAGLTPLLARTPTDIWTPAPFGVDERGSAVTIDLMFTSILVGAQPRQGKTFALRALALYAALDPYVTISVFDGGGKPDWRRFALLADRCSFGLAPTRDGDPVETLIDTLRAIKEDVRQRYVRLSDLPSDVCPEGKLTRAIARNLDYGMPVHLLLLDEFQEYFNTGNPAADQEIADLLVYLVRVAPAAGVLLGDATQRPSGIGSGGDVARKFTDFRDNHLVRFALRTGSWQVSDLVLGAGAYSEGLDSSTLLPQYKGVGILRGASEANPTVRTFLADAQDAEKILTAGRALRERLGTLSGHAAGQTTVRTPRNVLADVATLLAPGESGLHWADLAARLATRFPEHYTDITADAISAQLRDLGVPSANVRAGGLVRRGARATDITAAVRRADPASDG
ncbi:cell division protein FtsK [Frankia sp. Cj3]|uniref:cell division protein FtsK n=1 Tax=Frankia sp. Cj3 TaxID=2880976 RepID=UPI001EF55A78|nr:cell division protein FtsK [Frankia sp. Cj3]